MKSSMIAASSRIKFSAACQAVALFAAVSVSASDWPMAGRDLRRWNWSPDRISRPFVCSWMHALDERINGRVQPVIADGAVYIPTAAGNMRAFSLQDGAILWSFRAGGPILHSPSISGGNLFFGCQDGKVYALDARTGRELWTAGTGAGIWTSPAVADGLVLLGSRDGVFYAFDEKTGALRWKYATGGPIYCSAACADGRVYFGSDDMHLYCLDIESGEPVWRSEKLFGQSMRDYWPVLAAGRVIVTTMPAWPGIDYAAIEQVFQRFAPEAIREKGRDAYNELVPRSEEAVAEEQQAMIEFLWSEPARYRTFFVLDADTGRETLRTAVWQQGSWGGNMNPPTVAPDGTVFTTFRSRLTPWMVPYTVGWFRDLGTLDLGTGRLSSLIPGGGTYENQRALTDEAYHLHLVCDEHYCYSGAGDLFFISWSDHGLGMVDRRTGAALGGLNHRARPGRVWLAGQPLEDESLLPPDAGRLWTRIAASAAVSGEYLVYKYWSTVFCFKGKGGEQ